MNTAEIKLDLFRKIDNLKDTELERLYHALLPLLTPTEKYTLTNEERNAVEEASESSKKGETFTHESVMKDAQKKYPQLKFK
ncbi:MAG TPA: hypothetical protein VIH57_13390 [Bacteroidales bacterium]